MPLLPRVTLAPTADWFLPPEPPPGHGEERAEANLDRYLDEALASDRLEAGDVDPWYRELGRSMRSQFRPDPLGGERSVGALMVRALEQLRHAFSPAQRPGDLPGQQAPDHGGSLTDPSDRTAGVEWEAFEQCNPLNAPVTWHRVDLRVTHSPEGALTAVWVHRSSGNRALDRAAVAAARSGAVELRPPPEAVVGQRQAIRSDWAFELGDVHARIGCWTSEGPTVQLSCVDDPVLGLMCSVLGVGIIRTRVRLLAVVDADHETPEERRARRRRDPDRTRP